MYKLLTLVSDTLTSPVDTTLYKILLSVPLLFVVKNIVVLSPDNPEPDTPSEVVKTGASEITAIALGAGGVTTLVGYTIVSRRKF